MSVSPAVQADVVAFDDPVQPGRDATQLLGGKGAGLVEMTQALKLPVPPGFIITTEVCRRYLRSGWPAELDGQIAAHLERLGDALGVRFGDPDQPLLVSVRSGAPVSMPGMMDTLLNVGITPAVREALAASTGSASFAADTWLRFCRMYAETVLGLAGDEIAAAAMHDGSAAAAVAAAERVRAVARANGLTIPDHPMAQLRGAVEAVFRSWHSERARVFRAHEGIGEEMGTAVTVQAMVFGNLDDRSGTGVVFTRDPATGEAKPFGDYLARAQGEDVVAGTHAVSGLDTLRTGMPAVYAELTEALGRLERHYRDMCDVEFTVSGGRLFVLQTRSGRRSAAAAVRIAVEMAEDPDFPLDRAEAVARVDQQVLGQLANAGRVDPTATAAGAGLAASPGVAAGVLCFDADRAASLAADGVAVVLAREKTSPEDVHGMVGAAALLTTRGGVASHAAVVARSWSIPAVTSLEGGRFSPEGLHVGGLTMREGDLVTVDGSSGRLYLGDRREAGTVDLDEARTIREWAAALGVEPGTRAPSAGDGQTVGVTIMDVVRAIQLKGLCSAERAAAYLSASVETVTGLVGEWPQLFKETPRGFMPSQEGRTWLKERLSSERAGVRGEPFEACYARFSELNDRFKRLITDWQLAGQGQPEEALSALVASVRDLHEGLAPVIAESAGHVGRLGAYLPRFERALAALEAGDATMLASPLKDSYHTVWFDFHEELIELSGRDRLTEET
ncbi:MAG: pyruvate, phosphate dikinase [Dehalococcoidia bacterium]